MRTLTLKMSRISLILASVLIVSAFFSCSKDEDVIQMDDKTAFAHNYFDIAGATFFDKGLPGANDSNLNIIGLTGNTSVLAGGSNAIAVETGIIAKQILVGVSGAKGYFITPVDSNTNGDGNRETTVTLLLGQGLTNDLTIAFVASDGNGAFGNAEILEVNYLDGGTGLLQVSLSWDQENDVDLHLIEPNGEEIYYGHSYSENGGELDIDSNPACHLDYINNENIFYEEDAIIEEGEYEVLVDLYANCEIEDNTNYTIVAYYDGVLITPSEGENPHSGYLEPEDESYNTNLTSIMKFDIPNGDGGRPGYSNSNQPSVFKFNFEKKKEKKPLVLSPEKM